ncbi:hypothetical protein H6F98_00955 [Microcoleus sp. FACHB-SPT15]|uniref:hypothetical protein n=1 Tax=Microcoleus sp. FACHB-SPT15 TaxID=2692830 RepID=UPI00177B142D|nr:hypothetical protein [Microcoleus sp. FACHB-SPT15]MBD1804043.1 hypothetical protein [Microcoleus sp. FACHB-SPT15]
MTLTKIHLLTTTPLGILIVYFTNGSGWEFRVLSNGSIFGHSKIYYTAEAAERAGRVWVGTGW